MAAVVIDGRRLEIKQNGTFVTYIKPILEPDKCDELGLDPVGEEALKINRIELSQLETAPSLEIAWTNFTQFIYHFNPSKSKWNSLIKAGCNNYKFDDIIIDRICGGHNRKIREAIKKYNIDAKIKEPWGFGPWDEKRNEETLFYPRDNVDIMRVFFWPWMENMPDMDSITMDSMRDFLGMSKENAHDALQDCIDGANVLIRFLKLYRKMLPKIKFAGAFAR